MRGGFEKAGVTGIVGSRELQVGQTSLLCVRDGETELTRTLAGCVLF